MVLLPQSRDSSHRVLEAKCPPRPTHLLLVHGVDSTDHPRVSGVTWLYLVCILATDVFHKNAGTSTPLIAETH